MKCTEYNADCKRGCEGTCRMKHSYRPSNGTEGMIFTSEYCDHCIHENSEKGKHCKIYTATLFFAPYEPEYPIEWRYNSLGHPTCTAYVNWNWGENGDPDDPDNPWAPTPPPDIRQLDLFPLYPTELAFLEELHAIPNKV